MCGKFTQMSSWAEVHNWSDLLGGSGEDDDNVGGARSKGNDQEQTITPMRVARVIRLNEVGKREVANMRWGWPDRWSPAPMDRPKHMHARNETIDTVRTFKSSFAARRGIMVVNTFNVGEEVGKKVVQHVLSPVDGKPLCLAVIWEEVPAKDAELVLAFVMATTMPNPLIGTVTDRMPAILERGDWAAWLGETGAPLEEVKAVLRPFRGKLDINLQPKCPLPTIF
jgi:putative SOS response-associated peptidase YedK